MSRSGRGHSAGRVVGYRYHAREDYGFDPVMREIERVLKDGEEAGVVTQYDTGRGTDFWFDGVPGAGLRAVRREIERLVEGRVG